MIKNDLSDGMIAKIIAISFALFLSGCETVVPLGTPSGHPEVVVKTAVAPKVKSRFTGKMITLGFVVKDSGQGFTLFESLNPPVGVFPVNGIVTRTWVRLSDVDQGGTTRLVATVTMHNQAPGGQTADFPVVSGRSDMRQIQAVLSESAN